MPSSPLPRHTDPGLQPERTTMAWTRTAISMLIVSSILLRWIHVYGPAVFALMALLVGCAVYVVLSNRADYHRAVRGIAHDVVQPNITRVMVLSGAVILLGIGVIALVLAA